MSNKLTIEGLEAFKERIEERFSKKNHKHTTVSIEGLDEALSGAGRVKTVNNIEPDENGNITISTSASGLDDVNDPDIEIEDITDLFDDEEDVEELLSTEDFYTKPEVDAKVAGIDISGKADLSGANFTGEIRVPKIILGSGWELF